MNKISDENEARLAISILKSKNISTKEIQEVLNNHGLSYSRRGIDRVYETYKQRGTHKSNHKNSGRIKKYSLETEIFIVKHFEENFTSLREFKEDLTLNTENLSASTIQRILERHGLKAFQLGKTLALTETQMNQRLQFAKRHAQWRAKWKTVAFLDQIWFEVENWDYSHAWAYQKKNIPSSACKKVNDYPQKIHLLGIIGYDGSIALVEVEQNLNSEYFTQILNEHQDKLLNLILCLDLARFHTSNHTEEWLKENGIDYFYLPPKGADINVIENIWAILKREVFKIINDKKDNEEIFDKVNQIFFGSELIKQSIRNGYSSIPKRISQIIEKKGDIYLKQIIDQIETLNIYEQILLYFIFVPNQASNTLTFFLIETSIHQISFYCIYMQKEPLLVNIIKKNNNQIYSNIIVW